MERTDGHHRGCAVRPLSSLLIGLTALALTGCAEVGTEPDDAVCVDDATFFRERVYPEVVQTTCMACHTLDGVASASDLVFVTTARPDHLAVNAAALAKVAGLSRDGTSIVLRKPIGEDEHGGGTVIDADSEAFALLADYVARLDSPTVCEGGDDTVKDADAGLSLLSPVATLRKATLLLAGRLPTPSETDAVRRGGEPELVTALWGLMAEDAFVDVFLERLNDVLLTNKYLYSTSGIGLVDDDRFPTVYWYEGEEDSTTYSLLRDRTAKAIAREPLQLAAHIVRNDLPWTELITADYTMVNDYSALAYGVSGAAWPDVQDPASLAFRPAQVAGMPHAGLLTTPAFLNRYPTTATNRNRHRAWNFFKTFLATDILTFADRPIDPTVSEAHNPTLNDPQCTVCHATMDPVAGAFQNWDEEGRLNPLEEGWYPEMRSPGFGDLTQPATQRSTSLQWLAQQAAADPRFATAAVRTMLHAFTGVELYTPLTAGTDAAKVEALEHQDAWVEDVATEFVSRGHEIKYVIERVVRSRYFRAVAADGATEGTLLHAGTAHLLTPEELDRKITAVTGVPWRPYVSHNNFLRDRYAMLYGGIDSNAVTQRLTSPNGVMASIGLRMAQELACEAIPHDLVLPNAQRRLLPYIEMTYEPVTNQGFEVPGAKDAIIENIRWLHLRMLGEDLPADDPEILATWQLWRDVWQAGKAGVQAEEIDDRLDNACTAQVDPWTGDALPSDRRIYDDPDFTLRAWVAVFSYLAADWRFLHE